MEWPHTAAALPPAPHCHENSMTSSCLSKLEIAAWKPYAIAAAGVPAIEHTRRRMKQAGQWVPRQMLGRRMAIGCVALEITQRCNLDCTYCYLSESSEALKDIPLEEVLRRIDLIHAHYGPNTDVQITGGDPTLRRRDELVAIVRAIKARGMRSSLFTNGIKAGRDLLAELCQAGLSDVAFHVDMTQKRPGFSSEAELDALRMRYIERARGLPLAVIFNTTVFAGNLHEIPDLAQFFIRHADVVRFASFQVGAQTGRGSEGAGDRVAVNAETVRGAIRAGAGADLNFDAASTGHASCNGYAYGLIINGRMYDFFNDPGFVQQILASSAGVRVDRGDTGGVWRAAARYLLSHPGVLVGVASRIARLLWRERRDFIAARGRVGKLSFFVHNFMDAGALERERCEACSFMVMTPEGPLSMCVNNAKRDDYLLVPAKIARANRMLYFNPANGKLEDRIPKHIGVTLTRKTARGRAKKEIA